MLTRVKKNLKYCWSFCQILWTQFQGDACFMWASSLSYMTLLSLVPLLTSSFVLIKGFPAFKSLEGQLETFLFSHFVAGSAQAIQTYLDQFLQQALTLSAMGSLFLLITSVLLIFSMEKAFNYIWKTPSHRKGISAFLMYWGVLSLLPVLIALGLTLARYLASLPLIIEVAKYELLSLLISYSLTCLAFLFLYVSVPNCHVKIRYALIGGAVSALFFECAKRIFTIYIRDFSNYEVIYGSLAVVPLFLIWIYITWVIILFGVQLTHILQTKKYRV